MCPQVKAPPSAPKGVDGFLDAANRRPTAASVPLLYRPEEAAELLGCGRAYIYQLLAAGAIKSVKVGRLRRIPAVALDEYVAGLRA
jgi:excisionase family DNA binding protein